jgi:hypothetical protein
MIGIGNSIWLVVSTPLKNIWSMGRMIPNIMENKKCLKPPTSYIALMSFDIVTLGGKTTHGVSVVPMDHPLKLWFNIEHINDATG